MDSSPKNRAAFLTRDSRRGASQSETSPGHADVSPDVPNYLKLGFPPEVDEATEEGLTPIERIAPADRKLLEEIDFGLGPVELTRRSPVGWGCLPPRGRPELLAELRAIRARLRMSPEEVAAPEDEWEAIARAAAHAPEPLALDALSALAAAARAACEPDDPPEILGLAGPTAA